jgi:[ribosomal protein S5]-alanine N-acetyltransferase
VPPPITIRPAALADEDAFLAAVRRSRNLHEPWVQPPRTPEAFRTHISRRDGLHHVTFFIWSTSPPGLIGAANLNEIVRGAFQSAYLGYYAFEPFAGRGLMKKGLSLVISHAFRKMKLHRIEANIQPENGRSKEFAKALGFRREGYSPRYLKIAGRWRDHERWALLAEDW